MAAQVRKQAAGRTAPAKKKSSRQKKQPSGKRATGAAFKAVGRNSAGKSSSRQAGVGQTAEQPLMAALRAEHRHMATIMQLFADQLGDIEAGKLVDTHVVYEVMDYMATWPDRYHHPREDLIYSRVAELDPGTADDVDTLQRDHDKTAANGRALLREIERWREGESTGAAVVKLGKAYVDHLHDHMKVEEQLVFPRIESVLTSLDWLELAEDDRLRALPDPVFGPRVHREFRNMARRIRRGVRRGVEKGTMLEWIGFDALMESMEVLSMACAAARDSAGDHLRAAYDDSRSLFSDSVFTAPLRFAINNARLGYRLGEEVLGISRDTIDDLSRINRSRRDRLKHLDD